MTKVLYFPPAYVSAQPVLLDVPETAAAALVSAGAGAYPIVMPLDRRLTVSPTPSPTPAPTPTPTPSQQFIAIVPLLGQSDMAGRGTYSGSTDTNDSKVKQFPSDPGSSTTYRTIRDSIYPLYHPEGANSDQIGPGQTLGKRLAAQLGPNCVYVLLVPCAFGGTGLVASGGRWSVGGDLHEAAVAQINAAVAAAQALYPASYVHSFHWIQGNNDGTTAQQTYADALTPTITSYRTRCTTATGTTPFVMGSMLPIAIETQPGKQTIEAAQLDVAAAGTAVYYVPGPYGSVLSNEAPDYIHMGTTGCRAVGINMADTAMGQRSVAFGRATVSALEGNSGTTAVTFLAYRTDAVGTASAAISFLPGTTTEADYPGGVFPTPAAAIWNPGQNRATISIVVNGDVDLESDETFTLGIAAPSGYVIGTRPTVTGLIVNDDADNSGAVDADGYPIAGQLSAINPTASGKVWQDSAKTTPAVNDGDPVAAVDDSGPNGHHMTFQPGITLTTVNGKKALAFPGTSYGRANSLITPTNYFATDSVWTIHDAQVQDGTAASAIWGIGASGTSRRSLHGSTTALAYVERTSGGSITTTNIGAAVMAQPTVTSMRRGADGRITVLQDGVQVFSEIVAKASISGIIGWVWGGRLASGAFDQLLTGKKLRLRTYSTAQSDSDFLTAHNRMRARIAA